MIMEKYNNNVHIIKTLFVKKLTWDLFPPGSFWKKNYAQAKAKGVY